MLVILYICVLHASIDYFYLREDLTRYDRSWTKRICPMAAATTIYSHDRIVYIFSVVLPLPPLADASFCWNSLQSTWKNP